MGLDAAADQSAELAARQRVGEVFQLAQDDAAPDGAIEPLLLQSMVDGADGLAAFPLLGL